MLLEMNMDVRVVETLFFPMLTKKKLWYFYDVDSIDVKMIRNATDLLNMMLQQENILQQLLIIMILIFATVYY